MATLRVLDRVGQVLGDRYRLMAPVGTGASASVYLADDVVLRRRVAVKVLHPALADDEAFLRRFRAEAQAAASLNHPHVVAVYDWGREAGVPYLVTEYLGGGSVRSMLDAGRLLSPAQALLVGLEATRGLEYAHRRGFVHRDIKPANLLFDEDGRLRIADFGLARALAEAAWTEPMGAVLGTARYASPEQARGENLDGRSDVYSLALVLVEAVTGRVPFSADTTIGTLMARVDQPLPVPARLGALGEAIAAAGEPDPAQRLDAAELGIRLMRAASAYERPAPLPLVGATSADLAPDPLDRTAQMGLSAEGAVPVITLGPEPVLGPAGEPVGRPADGPDRIVIAEDLAIVANASAPPEAVTPETTSGDAPPDGGAEAGDGARSQRTPSRRERRRARRAAETAAAAVAATRGAPPGTSDDTGDLEIPSFVAAPAASGGAAVAAVADSAGGVSLVGDTGAGGLIVLDGGTAEVIPLDLTGEAPPLEPGTVLEPGALLLGADAEADAGNGTELGIRRRRRWPKVLALLVVLAAVAAGAYGWWYTEVRVPTHEVPVLVGLDVGQVDAALADGEWVLQRSEDRRDGTLPGEIIDQTPAAGTDLAEGEAVQVVVSLGPTLVDVPPTLVGAAAVDAGAALDGAGLVGREVERRFSEDVPADVVISLDGEYPPQLPKGSTIGLVVSDGPAPRVIPDGLIGRSEDGVVADLEALGLQPVVSYDYSDELPAGDVTWVEPRAGTEVPRDTPVTVVVSLGPELVTVPDVSTLSVVEAARQLEAVGLRVSGTQGSPTSNVSFTMPAAGAGVKPGTSVTLFTG
ncbi:MAG: PASTA domain-containing protein [Acidimicrobiales bacterium]|jgi:serine/threonine-protein kinase|nr:PASTA domain-containing protein [Acidimicrobiales bacterium]